MSNATTIDIARALFDAKQYAEAESLLRREIEMLEAAKSAPHTDDPNSPSVSRDNAAAAAAAAAAPVEEEEEEGTPIRFRTTQMQSLSHASASLNELYNNLALSLEGQDRNQEALEAYINAQKADPLNETVWVNIGSLYERNQEFDLAKQMYSKALELNPSLMQCRFRLGHTNMMLDATDGAVREWTECLRRDALFYDAYAPLAMILYDSGKHAHSLELLKQMEMRWPDDPLPHTLTGYVLAKSERLPDAVNSYRRALELAKARHEHTMRLNPHSMEDAETRRMACEPYINLAQILLRLYDPDGAFHVLEEALRLDPNNEFAMATKADALVAVDQLEEAESILRELLKLHPNTTFSYMSMCIFFNRFGRRHEVLPLLRQGLELNKDNPALCKEFEKYINAFDLNERVNEFKMGGGDQEEHGDDEDAPPTGMR